MRAAAAVGLLLCFCLRSLRSERSQGVRRWSFAQLSPVVVVGRGFTAREPVFLTATAGSVQRIVPLIARRNGTSRLASECGSGAASG